MFARVGWTSARCIGYRDIDSCNRQELSNKLLFPGDLARSQATRLALIRPRMLRRERTTSFL